ncbi:MAG: high-affinity branched-chain amino acid ABC transporter permease LivM [Alphaproteobacteria bacterium]|nr:high-affinity branched-chain amino acid ABC transporter permease LivM [Alphaproteobacteria bacterium]
MAALPGAAATGAVRTGSPISMLFKEAVVAAAVAALLALPLIGLETYDVSNGGLGIRTRFGWVVVAAATAFVGRPLLTLAARLRRARVPGGASLPGRAASWASAHRTAITAIGVGAAVALPFAPFASRYLVDLATTVLIYVMLGWGLNVVVGLAGLLDLGYVAFYAVGAYAFALLAQNLGFTFWQALPLSGLTAACFGIVLGFPVLRLRGDYLAIVTLGFGEIIRIVLLNWSPVTGGPNGIADIPRPSFFGLPFARVAPGGGLTFNSFFGIDYDPEHRVVFLYFVILAMALATNWFTLRLRRLPIGRAWEALREDEIACRALGINPTTVKLSAFATGAMLGGFAGCFFATRQGFISPESFTFMESAIILAIVVLGGMGSQLGVVLAAILLVTLPEFGRQFAEFRMLVFGAAMVAIMVWRPRGLLSYRVPTLRFSAAREPRS